MAQCVFAIIQAWKWAHAGRAVCCIVPSFAHARTCRHVHWKNEKMWEISYSNWQNPEIPHYRTTTRSNPYPVNLER